MSRIRVKTSDVRYGSKADLAARLRECPLYLQKRTYGRVHKMSAKCHKRTSPSGLAINFLAVLDALWQALPDHLVDEDDFE